MPPMPLPKWCREGRPAAVLTRTEAELAGLSRPSHTRYAEWQNKFKATSTNDDGISSSAASAAEPHRHRTTATVASADEDLGTIADAGAPAEKLPHGTTSPDGGAASGAWWEVRYNSGCRCRFAHADLFCEAIERKPAREPAEPEEWLRFHGHDPGDPCALVLEKLDDDSAGGSLFSQASRVGMERRGLHSTAMLKACRAGRLDIAQWLYGRGAAETVRTPSENEGGVPVGYGAIMCGSTPMFEACAGGWLELAKWLHAHGAAADVRTTLPYNGRTVLHGACHSGHLAVASWLCASTAAAADLTTATRPGITPLGAASCRKQGHIVGWLVMAGGADYEGDQNGGGGGGGGGSGGSEGGTFVVCKRSLARHVRDSDGLRGPLRLSLRRQVQLQQSFASTFLSPVCCRRPRPATSTASATTTAKKPCLLWMLGRVGDEAQAALLAAVMDFAGIAWGRRLRRAKEALALLEEIQSEEDAEYAQKEARQWSRHLRRCSRACHDDCDIWWSDDSNSEDDEEDDEGEDDEGNDDYDDDGGAEIDRLRLDEDRQRFHRLNIRRRTYRLPRS